MVRGRGGGTLRHLRGEGAGDGDEGVLGAAVVYRHLLPLARVAAVAVALVAELVEAVAAVHQHPWRQVSQAAARG